MTGTDALVVRAAAERLGQSLAGLYGTYLGEVSLGWDTYSESLRGDGLAHVVVRDAMLRGLAAELRDFERAIQATLD